MAPGPSLETVGNKSQHIELHAGANDAPNDIDKALDTLAEAIRRAEHGERKSMASYLRRLPAVSRTAKILAQLPSSQLMAFLQRHRAENDVADAVMPSIAVSGADDRIARANLFRSVTMASRMYALKRACDAAALQFAGA